MIFRLILRSRGGANQKSKGATLPCFWKLFFTKNPRFGPSSIKKKGEDEHYNERDGILYILLTRVKMNILALQMRFPLLILLKYSPKTNSLSKESLSQSVPLTIE